MYVRREFTKNIYFNPQEIQRTSINDEAEIMMVMFGRLKRYARREMEVFKQAIADTEKRNRRRKKQNRVKTGDGKDRDLLTDWQRPNYSDAKRLYKAMCRVENEILALNPYFEKYFKTRGHTNSTPPLKVQTILDIYDLQEQAEELERNSGVVKESD